MSITPTPKAPELVKLMEDLMGNKRDGKTCMACNSTKMDINDFRDDLSRREAAISCLCQLCQDNIFNTDEED